MKTFRYDFGDGWVCEVEVSIVSKLESAKMQKRSAGFLSYEWMIEERLFRQEITCGSGHDS